MGPARTRHPDSVKPRLPMGPLRSAPGARHRAHWAGGERPGSKTIAILAKPVKRGGTRSLPDATHTRNTPRAAVSPRAVPCRDLHNLPSETESNANLQHDEQTVRVENVSPQHVGFKSRQESTVFLTTINLTLLQAILYLKVARRKRQDAIRTEMARPITHDRQKRDVKNRKAGSQRGREHNSTRARRSVTDRREELSPGARSTTATATRRWPPPGSRGGDAGTPTAGGDTRGAQLTTAKLGPRTAMRGQAGGRGTVTKRNAQRPNGSPAWTTRVHCSNAW